MQYSGSGELYIDNLRIMDSGTTVTFAFQATGGKGRIGAIYTNKAHDTSQQRVTIAAAVYNWHVGSILLGSTDTLEGNVTLTNAGTSTSVTCGHVWRDYVGGTADYFHPIIQIVPWNDSAAALGNMRVDVTDYTSGTGFAIKHASAGATDYVYWKVSSG